MSDVIARIKPSDGRRVFGASVLAALGFLLIYIALARPSGTLQWGLFLLVVGAGALFVCYRLWAATSFAVELTEDGLRLSDGTEICRLDQIASVDRGFFAFKPSNGFLIRLKTRHPRAWGPGLWWRFGRRAGIGGVTRGAEATFMADTISAMLAQRDGV